MPQRLARRAFANQRPTYRRRWQVFLVQVSIRPIRLLLQLAGIQWEGNAVRRLPLTAMFSLLTSEGFIIRRFLRLVGLHLPFSCTRKC